MTTTTQSQNVQSFQTSEQSLPVAIFRMNEKNFTEMLTTPLAVQAVLRFMEGEGSEFWRKFHFQHSSKLKKSDRFKEYQNEKEYLLDVINTSKPALEGATNEKRKGELKSVIEESQVKLRKVQEQLDQKDSTELFASHMTSQMSDAVAKDIDRLANKVGEWFATGVVGPGTVTYRDRTFVAQ